MHLTFGYSEQQVKRNVRHVGNDLSAKVSHHPNMAIRPRKARIEQYDALRKASGWHLAAWRDHRGLTLDDLAAEVGVSKGTLSDLERGTGQRWNRDLVDRAAAALDVSPGYLLDVNPYAVDASFTERLSVIRDLDKQDQDTVFDLAERLRRRGS